MIDKIFDMRKLLIGLSVAVIAEYQFVRQILVAKSDNKRGVADIADTNIIAVLFSFFYYLF